MDRHTESFICLSLFVILLQNTARSEECTHSYTEAPGNISDLFDNNNCPMYICRYHVRAPPGHYIKLNITGLQGLPLVNECLPRLVIKNIRKSGQTDSQKLCNQRESLPLVVQSTDSELRIVFRGLDHQISSFNATFTFHRNTGPSAECLICARATQQQATHLAAATNASGMSTDSINHNNSHHTDSPNSDSPKLFVQPMEKVVFIILVPVAVVCFCCLIMYIRRRTSSSTHQQSQRLPSDNSPPTSHAPLLSAHSHNFSSSLHHQESLRQQRETICRRSESTEKFPSSVVLPDEEESSTMRHSVVLNRDLFGDNGIRPPPNRTVHDSEIPEHMMSERSRQQMESTRTSPQILVPRNPLLRTDSARSGTSRNTLVDSVTKSPLQFGDSDSEGPPPYSKTSNVCDPQHFVSNSAAAVATGHRVRHPVRGAHPQHANGRHPPVPLSPHYELDVDQGEQNRNAETLNRIDRMERSDHETTDVL